VTTESATLMGLLASADYVVLRGAAPVVAALEALTNRSWGVVVDSGGTPIGVVTADDLHYAEEQGAVSLFDPVAALPPAVVTDAAESIGELVGSLAVTLLDLGSRGLVVLRDAEIAGVVPSSEIDAFLAAGGHVRPPRTLGPHGDVSETTIDGHCQTGLANVVCAEPRCGHINMGLAFYDPDHPPTCTNPDLPTHQLRVGK
jgi:hypothetical protein